MLCQETLQRAAFFARGLRGVRHIAAMRGKQPGEIDAFEISDRFVFGALKRFVAGGLSLRRKLDVGWFEEWGCG